MNWTIIIIEALVLTALFTAMILKWNPGNHFQDNDKRLAKAFAWCVNKL